MSLRFHTAMTLQAAARIANDHGCELRITWSGKQAIVEAVPKYDPDSVPAFLRPQAPDRDESSERVVKLVQRG